MANSAKEEVKSATIVFGFYKRKSTDVTKRTHNSGKKERIFAGFQSNLQSEATKLSYWFINPSPSIQDHLGGPMDCTTCASVQVASAKALVVEARSATVP